ncbi:unnamed protein product [Euphydryas editha]|uniref:Uncharacterized protein n=1 Tax=Euphydryas editha TaxID=104508 RepID=A0AAU9TXV5_EUPED|nr:unnamed protein product [Euphydryas editha]
MIVRLTKMMLSVCTVIIYMYSESSKGWVQCPKCRLWAHCACAGVKDEEDEIVFLCEKCANGHIEDYDRDSEVTNKTTKCSVTVTVSSSALSGGQYNNRQ